MKPNSCQNGTNVRVPFWHTGIDQRVQNQMLERADWAIGEYTGDRAAWWKSFAETAPLQPILPETRPSHALGVPHCNGTREGSPETHGSNHRQGFREAARQRVSLSPVFRNRIARNSDCKPSTLCLTGRLRKNFNGSRFGCAMTVRFAGSRSLDERRRRRLASESEADSDPLDAEFSPRVDGRRSASGMSSRVTRAARFPMQALVAPQLWKHVLIGVAGLLLIGGVLLCGSQAAQWRSSAGPGMETLFGLPEARTARFFSAVILFLAGQVAALIWWVRSRSARDFAGRYAIWAWASGAWFAMSASVATDAHRAFGQTLVWLWDMRIWNAEMLAWLVPAIAIGEVLLTSLSRDMRGCRPSVLLLYLAPVFYVASIVLLFQPFAAEDEVRLTVIQCGTAMCGHLSLLMSMMLHARYVVYETSEPPPPRPGRLARWMNGFRLPRLGMPRIRRTNRVEAAEAAAGNVPDSEAPEPAKTPKPRKKPARTRAKTAPAEAVEEPSSPPPATAKTGHSEAVQPPQNNDFPGKTKERDKEIGTGRRIDPADDGPPNLKGLSKRERREAQKRWREQQRAAQQ